MVLSCRVLGEASPLSCTRYREWVQLSRMLRNLVQILWGKWCFDHCASAFRDLQDSLTQILLTIPIRWCSDNDIWGHSVLEKSPNWLFNPTHIYSFQKSSKHLVTQDWMCSLVPLSGRGPGQTGKLPVLDSGTVFFTDCNPTSTSHASLEMASVALFHLPNQNHQSSN